MSEHPDCDCRQVHCVVCRQRRHEVIVQLFVGGFREVLNGSFIHPQEAANSIAQAMEECDAEDGDGNELTRDDAIRLRKGELNDMIAAALGYV